MDTKYLYGLDLSMSCTGYAIFDSNENLIEYGHIKTDSKQTHGKRLKDIYYGLVALYSQYPPSIIIREDGYYRNNKSTKAIYKVHGIADLIFADVEQVYYMPTTVKKGATGNGRADKELVASCVLEAYPECEFKTDDESDAIAVVMTYLQKNK